ncbi:ABC transporter permease, partial [Deltaproteobacteria bacterium OttesenSCG-928-M10]|nr:ABC transporter permease [Deltaproteobacteria bacterium OttesenSCG-928-M10]
MAAHGQTGKAGQGLTLKAEDGRVLLTGPLTVDTPSSAWSSFNDSLPKPGGRGQSAMVFDLAGLTALDLNGSAQLLTAMEKARRAGYAVSTDNPGPYEKIFDLARQGLAAPMADKPSRTGLVEELGRAMSSAKGDMIGLVTFTGELVAEFWRAAARPWKVRWNEVMAVAERSGVNAVPIVSLVSFLVGLIIAFQAAMMMKMFGLEIYVADLVGISVVRELGPLIASIVLAGRSGSAFSAELGAMKAAEEVDAITTMGLSPVRELALPRVMASLLTTPLITLMAIFVGILGGSLVLLAMGYSMLVYWQEAVSQVSLASYFIGVGKSVVFGFVVGAVGCQRGLTAGDGPGAVGQATTSGVVTNIVLIAVLDSLFAVL